MKEIFQKYKLVIFRSLGAFMLLVGVGAYFWSVPKEGVSENEIAAANVARMEASVMGGGSSAQSQKPDSAKFLEELKSTQEKQMEYLTIASIVLGVLFLLYSFTIKRDSEI